MFWPLTNRLEADEFCVQVDRFVVGSSQFVWEGFWSVLKLLDKGLWCSNNRFQCWVYKTHELKNRLF